MQLQAWNAGAYINRHTIRLPGGAAISAAIRLYRVAHPNTTGIVVKRAEKLFDWPNDGDEIFLRSLGTTDSTVAADLASCRVWFMPDAEGHSQGIVFLSCENNGARFTYYTLDFGYTWTLSVEQ